MLSKCANPECNNRFLYFRGGKLVPIDLSGLAQDADRPAVTRTARQELFWLCPECSDTVTLVVDQGKLTTTPIPRRVEERGSAA